MKKPTIHAVAAKAGVSLMTVSRVVNNAANVAAGTRQRVLEAIDALGFRPNQSARSLRSQRSHWIALLSQARDDPASSESFSYMADLQAGIIARCRQDNYHVSFNRCDPKVQGMEDSVLGVTTRLWPDGVLLLPPLSASARLLAALRRLHVPVVRIAPADFADASPCVHMDDEAAARQMTEYLLGLGHRRIGFIKGHPEHVASAQRLAGYRAALSAAGLKAREQDMAQGYFTLESGIVAAREILGRTGRSGARNRLTAIFASNDDMAAGCLAVAQELHIRVPQGLSIVGFDDTYVTRMLWPALTTVRQPIYDMGFTATHQLLGLILTGKATQRVTLSHRIVERASVAAPAGQILTALP